MSKFGRMPKYLQPCHQQNEWQLYKERMDQFFEANAIEDASELDLEARKVENLLTCIGPTVYKKLREFCDPVLPKEKTYEELCLILKSQFTPQTSVYKERKTFYDARQRQGEFVNQWFIRIKRLAVNCEFNERLNNMLQDKFVTGLTSGNILDRLYEVDPTTTTLDECVNLALQQEAAMRGSVMQMRMPRNGYDGGPSHSHYQGVAAFRSDMVSNKQRGYTVAQQPVRTTQGYKAPQSRSDQAMGSSKQCFACGKTKHDFKNCIFKTYTCAVCGKVGHIAEACKKNKNLPLEKNKNLPLEKNKNLPLEKNKNLPLAK